MSHFRSAPSAVLTLLSAILLLPSLSAAFYLPGVAPTSYKPGDHVPLYVNSIKPVAPEPGTPLRAVISYDYYNPSFKFCRPVDGPKSIGESLGSILFGDRIMTSPFDLEMGKNLTCASPCDDLVQYDQKSTAFLRSKIELGYSLHWLVDGLPAGQEMDDVLSGTRFYTPGFLMGQVNNDRVLLNNHYHLKVEYHEVNGNPDQLRVVGVAAEPSSIDYGGPPDCDLTQMRPKLILYDNAQQVDVYYSYSVDWIKSNTAWATRWDKYLHVFDPMIHWFWLVITAIIVVLLTLAVMSVLVRTLKKDIARYNRLNQISLDDLTGTSALDDDIQEDSGWKLVHGDVFRPPSYTLLLSVLVGNGAQIFVMTAITLLFALLGFLSPSNRGSLGSIMIVLFTLLSFIGGMVSARVYKAWQGEKWKMNIVLTPLVVPVIIFGTFLFLNLFLWAKKSSGAVPFTTMLLLVAIWFVVSVPLSVCGSWLGFRAPAPVFPVRTNQIPRQIPPGPTHLRLIPSMFYVGMLPFAAIFVELYFIMSSIWFSRIYYMFGFLFLSYGLMIVTCASATVLMVYFLLCAENYNWQWRSFLAAGMSGSYVFANSMLYLVSKLHLGGFAGIVLYVGYSTLLSFLFSILTGTIGYFSSWWFVRKIYSSLKVD